VFGIFSAFPKISRHYLTNNELDLEDCINEGTVQHMTLTEAMMLLWMRMEMIPHSNEGTSALYQEYCNTIKAWKLFVMK
jgi:hypothetical protein